MDQINETKSNIAKGYIPKGHRTIFYDLITNPEIPEPEKDTERLRTEAQSVLIAGTVTAAHILTNIAYHIIDNPPILKKLREELKTLMPADGTKPKWQELNQLEYLVSSLPMPQAESDTNSIRRSLPASTKAFASHMVLFTECNVSRPTSPSSTSNGLSLQV